MTDGIPASQQPPRPPPPELAEAYARLRRIAQRLLSDERNGHTMSATDVVHEALSKLLASGWQPTRGQGEDEVHFIHHAARAMTDEVMIHQGTEAHPGTLVRLVKHLPAPP